MDLIEHFGPGVGHLNNFAVPGVGIFELLFVPVVAIWVQHLYEKAENQCVGAKKAAIKRRGKRSSKQTHSSKSGATTKEAHSTMDKGSAQELCAECGIADPPAPCCEEETISWVSCDGCVLWWHITCLGFDMKKL